MVTLPESKSSVELSPQQEAERFHKRLAIVVDEMIQLETRWENIDGKSKEVLERDFFDLQARTAEYTSYYLDEEKRLFYRLFDLFSLKHQIGPFDEITAILLTKRKNGGKFIGFMGPLGVGKSTVAEASINDLDADYVVREPYQENPFWSKSQQDTNFMLRSQVYFLFSNTFTDMRARLESGISVSDTSSLTDLMWAQWYNQLGHFDTQEYQTYLKLVELLKPIMPKPDLLVTLVPDSVDGLVEGIKNRQKNEPWRQGELVFTREDLNRQTKLVAELSQEMADQWNVPVLTISVSPMRIYDNPLLNYEYIYQIRSELNILSELLEPQPEEVASQVMQILAESSERSVIVIHSKSMFSGKTTAMWHVANQVGQDRILAFQPKAALRYFGQEDKVMSRDGLTLQATTIKDNSLWRIVKAVNEEKINPKDYPYLFIDEVMLSIGEAQNHKEAVWALETLRKMGFHVIINGIDYTFQEEPFTFMHQLLAEAKSDPNWHEIEMSTRCRYCGDRARGTRRWKVDENGKRSEIADYNDTAFKAGDSEYEPVCCGEHKSCLNQPEGFERKMLPTGR